MKKIFLALLTCSLHIAAMNEPDYKFSRSALSAGRPIIIAERTPDDDLFQGSRYGNLELVQNAIKRGAYVNGTVGNRSLHLAAQNNHSAVIEYLIAQGIPVNIPNSNGETPLHTAAAHTRVAAAASLLALGAHINIQDRWKWTPLHSAFIPGKKANPAEIVALLLEHGADADLEISRDRTAYNLAVEFEHTAVAELIMSKQRGWRLAKIDPVDTASKSSSSAE